MLKINLNYKKCQWLFISLTLILFVGMNLGVLKYNDILHSLIVVGGSAFFFLLYLRKSCNLCTDISEKCFWWSIACTFIISFIAMAVVIKSVDLPYYSDFIIAREQAIYFADQNTISPKFSQYFHAYPFNINTVFFLGWLYKLTGNYHYVELITATIVNITAIVTGFTVRNVTKNNILSLIIAVVYEFYSIFCMKTYMPYTSNVVLLFPILIMYLYTLKFSKSTRIVLISIVAFIGYNIKITAIIPYIGIMIVEGTLCFKNKELKIIGLAGVCCIICFMFASLYTSAIQKSLNFEPNPTIEHNTIYYLAMGQNNEYGGQYYLPIAEIGDQYRPKEERDSLFLNMALDEIKQRSILGQVKFFVAKIAICWGEVHQDHLKFCSVDRLLIAFRHLFWYFSLLLMTIGVFIIKDKKYYSMLLGLFGVVLYLYLSEAGSRYVIMFSPIVFAMMGWTMSKIKKI